VPRAFLLRRCKKDGPANWGGDCGAAEQSPIDLCGAKPLPDRGLAAVTGAAVQVKTDQRLVFNKEYGNSHTLSFDTEGKAQIDFAGKGFSLDATDLVSCLPHGPSMKLQSCVGIVRDCVV
jgi:hypothetical protein